MSALMGSLAKKVGPALVNRAKKAAMQHGRQIATRAANQAQKRAKQFAAQKARQLANTAKRQANARITSLVTKHMGNNNASRALANKLKAHVTNKINTAHAATQTAIKTAPPVKMF